MTEGPNGAIDADTRSWASSTGVAAPPPGNVIIVRDALPVAVALSEAQGGRHLLYLGHYANARRLLAAMGRRLAGYHSSPGTSWRGPGRRDGRGRAGGRMRTGERPTPGP
jgi:hypothetical protein